MPTQEDVPRCRRGAPGLGVRLRPTHRPCPATGRPRRDDRGRAPRDARRTQTRDEAVAEQAWSGGAQEKPLSGHGRRRLHHLRRVGAKLSDLEEIRTTAVEKLEAIRNRQERIEEME